MATPSMKITSQIDFSGPFFEKDPAKTFSDNIRDYIGEIAGQIADDVKQQIGTGRAPIRAIGPDAHVAQFVRGRVQALTGNPWHYHGVVSPDATGLDAKQAVALYAAAAQLERRTRAFARSARVSRRQKTDLTKGIE